MTCVVPCVLQSCGCQWPRDGGGVLRGVGREAGDQRLTAAQARCRSGVVRREVLVLLEKAQKSSPYWRSIALRAAFQSLWPRGSLL